jgi:hypothetical protein
MLVSQHYRYHHRRFQVHLLALIPQARIDLASQRPCQLVRIAVPIGAMGIFANTPFCSANRSSNTYRNLSSGRSRAYYGDLLASGPIPRTRCRRSCPIIYWIHPLRSSKLLDRSRHRLHPVQANLHISSGRRDHHLPHRYLRSELCVCCCDSQGYDNIRDGLGPASRKRCRVHADYCCSINSAGDPHHDVEWRLRYELCQLLGYFFELELEREFELFGRFKFQLELLSSIVSILICGVIFICGIIQSVKC